MAERPKLVKIGAEMQRWCALLEEELSTWPDVTSRPMFGMMAYYRGPAIFCAIPRTRAAGTAFSLLIKRPDAAADRVGAGRGPGAAWGTFELTSEGDLAQVLKQLARAYEIAGKARRQRRPRQGKLHPP